MYSRLVLPCLYGRLHIAAGDLKKEWPASTYLVRAGFLKVATHSDLKNRNNNQAKAVEVSVTERILELQEQ